MKKVEQNSRMEKYRVVTWTFPWGLVQSTNQKSCHVYFFFLVQGKTKEEEEVLSKQKHVS